MTSRPFVPMGWRVLFAMSILLSILLITLSLLLTGSMTTPDGPGQVAFCGVESGAIAASAAASSAPVVFVDDAGTRQGESVALPVRLTRAPRGVSGYVIELGLEDPARARITGVEMPELGLTREVSATDFRTRVAAADLFMTVESGETDVLLAEVRVQGLSQGTTGLDLRVVALDDDSGDPVPAEAQSGTLTIC